MAVPPALERVVRTCLSKDPGQRFQTALELKRALAWAFEQPAACRRGRAGDGTIAHCRGRRNLARWAVGPCRNFGGRWCRNARSASTLCHRATDDSPSARVREGSQYRRTDKPRLLSPRSAGEAPCGCAHLTARVVRPLFGTEGAYSPFWSPDSKSIAFFAEGKLRRVDLTGLAATTICETPGPGRGGTWTNDGRILFAALATPILQVPALGGTPSALTNFDASQWRRRALLAAGASRRKLFVPGAKRQAGWQWYLCGIARQSEPSRSAGDYGHQRHLRLRLFALDARHHADGSAVRCEAS